MVREARCSHGFLRSVAPCPKCEALEKPKPTRQPSASYEPRPWARRFTDEQLLAALRGYVTLADAAESLGLKRKHLVMFYDRAKHNPDIAEAMQKRKGMRGQR